MCRVFLTVVYVTGRGPHLKEPATLDVYKAELEQKTVVIATNTTGLENPIDKAAGVPQCKGGSVQRIVSCGSAGKGIGIRIVDSESCTPSAPGRVGQIWVSGPSKAQGYWGKPELTRQTFQATINGDSGNIEYLRTGDLGFMHEGELYVCGRMKDLIIVRGRNIYPQDIERCAEGCHSTLRPGCSGAFSLEVAGEEQLVLLAEVRGEPNEEMCEQVICCIQKGISVEHQLMCHAILILKQKSIPKTTSGKIRRAACKQAFEEWSAESNEQTLHVVAWKVPNRSGDGSESRSLFVPMDVTIDICPDDFMSKPADASEWVCQTIYNLVEQPCLDLLEIQESSDLLFSPGLSSLQFATLQSCMDKVCGVPVFCSSSALYTPREGETSIDTYTVDSIVQLAGRAVRKNHGKCTVEPSHVPQTNANSDPYEDTLKLPLWLCRFAQLIGLCSVVVMAAAALFLPYYFGRMIQYGNCDFKHYYTGLDACLTVPSPLSYFDTANHISIYGLLVPLLVILWMIVFTAEVVMVKWIIVGRYTEGVLGMQTFGFLQWWFLDRVFDMWDMWVGYFIGDTIMQLIVYKCLGLDIGWGSTPPFLREFDLVSIGASCDCGSGKVSNSVIEHGRVRLRRVKIGDGCTLKTLSRVMPGCTLCAHTTLQPLTIMLEGSVVSEPRLWKGNPATSEDVTTGPDNWSASTNVVLLLSKRMTPQWRGLCRVPHVCSLVSVPFQCNAMAAKALAREIATAGNNYFNKGDK